MMFSSDVPELGLETTGFWLLAVLLAVLPLMTVSLSFCISKRELITFSIVNGGLPDRQFINSCVVFWILKSKRVFFAIFGYKMKP